MKARTILGILAVGLFLAGGPEVAADRAVPRGSGRGGERPRRSSRRAPCGPARDGAQFRHPRPGTGSGYYGQGYRGYSHGYRGYSHGYRGSYGYRPYSRYGYYGHRPYYGYPYYYGSYGYPYYWGQPYAWGWGGGPYLSVGLGYASGGASVGVGYTSGGPSSAPYDPGYAAEESSYASEPPANERRADAGEVVLDVQPEDASVYVDDQFRGTGREVRRIRLRPGRHRLEIVRPGYRVHQDEFVVEPGGRVAVEVILERS